MGWPLSQDYNEAIQSPATSFRDPELRQGEAVLNPLGLPLPRSGNFADVYETTCPGGAKWAVKCFTRQVADHRERYAEISRHLQEVRLPFGVEFQYLVEGIRVRGRWYPVLKMRWVSRCRARATSPTCTKSAAPTADAGPSSASPAKCPACATAMPRSANSCGSHRCRSWSIFIISTRAFACAASGFPS